MLCGAVDVKVYECLYLYDVDYIQIASQFVIFCSCDIKHKYCMIFYSLNIFLSTLYHSLYCICFILTGVLL